MPCCLDDRGAALSTELFKTLAVSGGGAADQLLPYFPRLWVQGYEVGKSAHSALSGLGYKPWDQEDAGAI